MKIRVYNQNGKVKITKTMSYRELTMFSDLKDGEMAEIEIGVTQTTNGKKRNIGDPESHAVHTDIPTTEKPFAHAIAVLRFARDNQCLKPEDAERAIAVLQDTWENDQPGLTVGPLFGCTISILWFAANTDSMEMSLTSDEARCAIAKLEQAVYQK